MHEQDPLPVIVLGSINMDVVMQVATLPAPGETVMANAVAHYPGGKGANQAVAAARMGANVAMLGAVGEDAFGDELLSVLFGEGIDLSGLSRLRDRSTGTAYIAIDPAGENQILVAGGANRAVDPTIVAHAPPAPAVRLAQLETPVAAVAAFLADGDPGTISILNAAPAVADAKPLFALCDIVIVNEVELAAFAGPGRIPDTVTEVAACARGLLDRDAQWIVVTRGRRGAIAVSRAELIETPARAAEVVDTTGAGDCFCGVLAAALAAHQPIAAALGTAAAAAALSVERHGAIPSLPKRNEVAAKMRCR